jgi:hypothetical protein
MQPFITNLLLASALMAGAASAGEVSAGRADTAKIHSDYLDGDFDKATGSLERWLAAKAPMSHDDSVFAFKHLGVMYAARNETREKGKYYMLKLLEVEPTARILDMYASDMIYMIFKNIREEFEANRSKLTRAEGHMAGNGQKTPPRASTGSGAEPITPAKPEPAAAQPRREGKSNTVYWVAGAGVAVAVAGAITAYFIFQEQPVKKIPYDVQ